MSSVYRVLCLNHDPAIRIDHDWNNGPEAIDAAVNPERYEALEDHKGCDLLVGRWSGGLVEIGCPPQSEAAVRTDVCLHRGPAWISVEWLRLFGAALRALPNPELEKALEVFRRPYRCWAPERVERLRSVL
jgi:hypothetical protein